MTRWTEDHSAGLHTAPVLGLNFHHVASEGQAQMRQAITQAAGFGESLELADVRSAESPADATEAPKVFVAFYDGLRDTGLLGAELCHRLGIRAYFFPLFTPVDDGDGELTDDDLADISSVHEIGFHTSSHLAADEITPGNHAHEVIAPMERIRRITGRRPRVAAWRGGSRFDESHLGNRSLRDLGVGHLVSNWSVEAIPQRQ